MGFGNPFKSLENKIKKGFSKLGDSIKKGIESVGKKIEKEVIDKVRREGNNAIKSVKTTFEKELPQQLQRITSELEKKIKKEFEQEFKKQIVGRLFGVGDVGVKHGSALNKLIPTSSLTIGASVAGSGITFSWEGQDQVARVFAKAKVILDKRVFRSNDVGALLLEVLPNDMTIAVGGSVTPSALVIGTDIDLAATFTVEKERIRETIRNLPRILATLSQMPTDVMKKVILNK